MGYRWASMAAGLVLLMTMAGGATATHALGPGPIPGPDDVAADENDVRDEANHPDDGNGFPPATNGDFWSPKEDALILEGFVVPGEKYHHAASLDVQNLLNLALQGDNYRNHEQTMYPGTNRFAAWWGWWSDTGGGGDVQGTTGADAVPGIGEPNGAIDDADDCGDAQWDEFTFRGPHPCPTETDQPSYPDDQLFAFVQPGTHAFHLNNFFKFYDKRDDAATSPDFRYSARGQRWEEVPRPLDIEYDASLLITTSVVTAANPEEITTSGPGTAFDPFDPDGDLADPARDHAVDVDLYTTPNPLLERAYRTAVWDPGNNGEGESRNPDILHEDGPKAYAKDRIPELQRRANEEAGRLADQVLLPTQRQRGLVDDLVQGPFFHEPNTPDDRYGITPTGSDGNWATFDPATTYGGLEGAYYDPGPKQGYTGYQAGEHLWADVQVAVDTFPSPIAWGFFAQVNPEAPAPDEPVESTAREDHDNTQAPGFLYMDSYVGTWYDANDDGWVGAAGVDGYPYENGTVDDPNVYDIENDPTTTGTPEFRGSCTADLETTLRPTSDSDGDGTNDWGAAGVYVMDPMTITYASPWMDVLGSTGEPAQDTVRDNVPGGSTVFPDRDRLANYRRTGPIHLDNWAVFCDKSGSGFHQGAFTVVLPTGTLDFSFEAETRVELEDKARTSQHGDNKRESLTGEEIVDVDRYDAVVEVGS